MKFLDVFEETTAKALAGGHFHLSRTKETDDIEVPS